MKELTKGAYVLATKYQDGDPHDHWFVGFFRDKTWHNRYNITDGEGQMQRGNGFRKAHRVSTGAGLVILENMGKIQASNVSLWWWWRYAMKKYP